MSLIVVVGGGSLLTIKGYETDRFNKLVEKKIKENYSLVKIDIKKIKFKLDLKKFNLYLETKEPALTYKNIEVPIKKIKVYLDFVSLIKTNPKLTKVNLETKELSADQLKKIIVKTKPSNLNSLINNKIKKGKIKTNLEIYFDERSVLKNFIAKGEVREVELYLSKNLKSKKTSFNFFADNSDILIKNIQSQIDGIEIKKGNLQIVKEKKIILKSDFLTSVKLNDKNIHLASSLFKRNKFINKKTIFEAELHNFVNITFDETLKVIDYDIKNKGDINKMYIESNNYIESQFLEKKINKIFIKKAKTNSVLGTKIKDNINISGKYSFDDSIFQNFDFTNTFSKKISEIELQFDLIEKFNFNLINYNKDYKKKANIFVNFLAKKNSFIIKKLDFKERNNSIYAESIVFKNDNLSSIKKLKVKTYDKDKIKNDFNLQIGKNILIEGNSYDANNLNKLLDQKSNSDNLKELTKNIEINFKNIDTSLSNKIKNFRLLGSLEKGKFVKITSKGDFGNNKFLDISMKNDKKNKRKFLEIYSDLPQPLLSEYSFFKGLSDGVLTYNSIIEDETSTSKLIIDNFKVINAPGVVKLLSLADFGGLADLAEGEGLSFSKMEIKLSTSKNLVKIDELYAVGPSISVLMEGYKEISGLTSLRGTLVPAKNLNKFLSKIPVLGEIIIPKEVGEGLFGVSFKMKGMPDNIKTTINPIKTLTPRFITKALEKNKKSK